MAWPAGKMPRIKKNKTGWFLILEFLIFYKINQHKNTDN